MRFRTVMITVACALQTTGAFAQNARMGARYQIIESEVESVVTRFKTAEVTSLRVTDGTVVTTLRNRSGQVISEATSQPVRFRLTPTAAGSGEPVLIGDRALDFINADAYLAWRNREPRRGAYKPLSKEAAALLTGDGPAELSDAEDDVRSVTMLTKDYEALARRTPPNALIAQPDLPAFTAALRKRDTGELVAVLGWHEEAQMLVFSVKGEKPKGISKAVLPSGWSFQPNEAWADVQLLSLMKSEKAHQQHLGVIATALRPIVTNDPGCDMLHWLDGSMFRPCCDIHDACYETEWPPCEAGKSWFFMGSWHCTTCNIQAIVCFAIIFDLYPIDVQIYSYDPPPPNCYVTCCYCPAWCYGCLYQGIDW